MFLINTCQNTILMLSKKKFTPMTHPNGHIHSFCTDFGTVMDKIHSAIYDLRVVRGKFNSVAIRGGPHTFVTLTALLQSPNATKKSNNNSHNNNSNNSHNDNSNNNKFIFPS